MTENLNSKNPLNLKALIRLIKAQKKFEPILNYSLIKTSLIYVAVTSLII